MPNPDDILPKEAWTDFSGTDDWPRFSGHRRRSASDHDDIGQEMDAAAPATTESKKPLPPNYVNCQPDHCQKEDNSANRVCPQQQQQPLHSELNFQKKPIFKRTKSHFLTFSKVQKHIFC